MKTRVITVWLKTNCKFCSDVSQRPPLLIQQQQKAMHLFNCLVSKSHLPRTTTIYYEHPTWRCVFFSNFPEYFAKCHLEFFRLLTSAFTNIFSRSPDESAAFRSEIPPRTSPRKNIRGILDITSTLEYKSNHSLILNVILISYFPSCHVIVHTSCLPQSTPWWPSPRWCPSRCWRRPRGRGSHWGSPRHRDCLCS